MFRLAILLVGLSTVAVNAAPKFVVILNGPQTSDYWSQVSNGATDAAEAGDISLVLVTPKFADQWDVINAAVENAIADGFPFVAPYSPSLAAALQKADDAELPYLAYGRTPEGRPQSIVTAEGTQFDLALGRGLCEIPEIGDVLLVEDGKDRPQLPDCRVIHSMQHDGSTSLATAVSHALSLHAGSNTIVASGESAASNLLSSQGMSEFKLFLRDVSADAIAGHPNVFIAREDPFQLGHELVRSLQMTTTGEENYFETPLSAVLVDGNDIVQVNTCPTDGCGRPPPELPGCTYIDGKLWCIGP
ncbi:type 1 periplasmic-binding domain-containing protein [Devosia beringensis]|uniref:hypothetical protein n=1 Tax=Devosia beringensis TaxID=2657486 RepID=UPI00186B9E4D|nr:hypothetical protein [Devosia beringensis]